MSIREVLIYLSCKYNGEWEKIYYAIVHKERVSEEEINKNNRMINCEVITILDDNYPINLKNCYHPPFVLFYKGDISILEMNIISIVGSRNASNYAKESIKKIIDDLKDSNVAICSGFAKGIDTIVHQQSLNNGLKTIAILPVGIDLCYPQENFQLYEQIEVEGLIISEYPFCTRVEKKNFIFRNRLIASLCSKIVIASAKEKSGTLVSAKYAIEYGKDVYALPYPINENNCCNSLIKEGAYLIESGKDLF